VTPSYPRQSSAAIITIALLTRRSGRPLSKKEKNLTKFDGKSYEFNFSKFTKAPYENELPNEDFIFSIPQLLTHSTCLGSGIRHVDKPKASTTTLLMPLR
jgi:hypothetical protein